MKRVNGPLWLGITVLAFIAGLALWGPSLAPQDPMQENFIVQNPLTGKFIKPPLPILTVPGFPLGTDGFGRDVLSRLLWAVRPSLTLVLMVAALRLIVGTALGVWAGWASGPIGRALDGLIAGALAVPVLFVALCVLAAVGQGWGVWAFILGLSLTGWGEAARLVREQTRSVKHQPFIEAARALGASEAEIVGRHVLPQIMPLVWILFSFEASGTLLLVAGLGFLGYFVNAVWVPLGDWTGIRASGQPELGQMLAVAADTYRQPWNMLAAGSVVFLTVLGFNLLGEGLRLQMSQAHLRQRAHVFTRLAARLTEALEARGFDPLSAWRRNLTESVALGVLLMLVAGGTWALWQTQAPTSQTSAIVVPGAHLWAADAHDAQGTAWTSAIGPSTNVTVTWVFTTSEGFAGGPVVAADGTVYVAARDNAVLALDTNGQLLWRAELPSAPVWGLALGELGDVYALGEQGELWAVTPNGKLRWAFQPARPGLTLAAPIVGNDGTVYYSTETTLNAVTVDGVARWQVPVPSYSYVSPALHVDVANQYVYFEDYVLEATTGALAFDATDQILDKYIFGVDGRIYLSRQVDMLLWTPTATGASIREYARWDGRSLGLGFRFPSNAGVLPDGRAWAEYGSAFEFIKLLWLDANHQPLTPIDYAYRGTTARRIGMDGASTTYMCGTPDTRMRDAVVECRANAPGSNTPMWQIPLLHEAEFVVGGALVPGRLYVALAGGSLFAVGEARP